MESLNGAFPSEKFEEETWLPGFDHPIQTDLTQPQVREFDIDMPTDIAFMDSTETSRVYAWPIIMEVFLSPREADSFRLHVVSVGPYEGSFTVEFEFLNDDDDSSPLYGIVAGPEIVSADGVFAAVYCGPPFDRREHHPDIITWRIRATVYLDDIERIRPVVGLLDLHKRAKEKGNEISASFIPSFWRAGFTSMVFLEGESTPDCMEFETVEITGTRNCINEWKSTKKDQTNGHITLKEHPATSSAKDAEIDSLQQEISNTEMDGENDLLSLKIQLPKSCTLAIHLRDHLSELQAALTADKPLHGLIRPFSSVLTFVLCRLGGTLFLSNPPTIEELRRLFHVIRLYEHFKSVTDLVFVPAVTALLSISDWSSFDCESLISIIWNECFISRPGLAILIEVFKTFKTNPAQRRPFDAVLKRMASHLMSTGAAHSSPVASEAFVEFLLAAKGALVGEVTEHFYDFYGQELRLYSAGYCHRSDFSEANRFSSASLFDIRDADYDQLDWRPETRQIGSYGNVLRSGWPIARMFAIVSNSQRTNVNHLGYESNGTIWKLLLVHPEVLYMRWRWFRTLISSGLNEARTRVVEMPYSFSALHLVCQALYFDNAFRWLYIDMPHTVQDCDEILSNTLALGLRPPREHQGDTGGYLRPATIAEMTEEERLDYAIFDNLLDFCRCVSYPQPAYDNALMMLTKAYENEEEEEKRRYWAFVGQNNLNISALSAEIQSERPLYCPLGPQAKA